MSDIENTIRKKVRFELQNCSEDVTPNIWGMLQSPGGYNKVENMVIQYALKNDISISAAIGQLESSL